MLKFKKDLHRSEKVSYIYNVKQTIKHTTMNKLSYTIVIGENIIIKDDRGIITFEGTKTEASLGIVNALAENKDLDYTIIYSKEQLVQDLIFQRNVPSTELGEERTIFIDDTLFIFKRVNVEPAIYDVTFQPDTHWKTFHLGFVAEDFLAEAVDDKLMEFQQK